MKPEKAINRPVQGTAIRQSVASLVLSFFIAILGIENGYATTGKSITIVTEEFPPYNYTLDGQAVGLFTDVVKAVLDELELDISIDFYPWARSYNTALADKNVLIFSIARIPERENLFHWVGEIAPYRTSLYKLKRNKDVSVEKIEDAKAYRIGVSREDVIQSYLENQGFTNLEVANQDALNIKKLLGNRISLLAYDEASFVHQIKESELDLSDFERVFRLDDLTGSLYMAFSRDTDLHTVEQFRSALQRITKNGILDKIQARYFHEIN